LLPFSNAIPEMAEPFIGQPSPATTEALWL
jgi:hypothetical protein